MVANVISFPPLSAQETEDFIADAVDAADRSGDIQHDFRLALGNALGLTTAQIKNKSIDDLWKRYNASSSGINRTHIGQHPRHQFPGRGGRPGVYEVGVGGAARFPRGQAAGDPSLTTMTFDSFTEFNQVDAVGFMISGDGKRFYAVRDDGATSQVNGNTTKFATAFTPEATTSANLTVYLSRGTARVRDAIWGENGTSIWCPMLGTDRIDQYNHTDTAFEVSSSVDATPDVTTGVLTAGKQNPRSLDVSSDGTRLIYVTNDAGRDIIEMDMSTAWDLSTASDGDTFAPTEGDMLYAKFGPNGSKLYTMDVNGTRIYEYALPTAYDISSASTTSDASYLLSDDFPVEVTIVLGFEFNPDGSQLFVMANDATAADAGVFTYTF